VVKRIRIKDGIPEYMEITSDGRYFNVSVIRDAQMYHYGYHGKELMDLINWLYEHGWSSGI